MAEQILVEICAGRECRRRGALDLLSQVERLYAGRGDVRVVDAGCRHYCEDGPVAVVGGQVILRATLAAVTAAVSAVGEAGGADDGVTVADEDISRR